MDYILKTIDIVINRTAVGAVQSGESLIDENLRKKMDKIYNVYKRGYAPPKWAKELLKKEDYYEKYMPETKVYYPEGSDLNVVKKLAKEREPVNITMNRYYNQDKLENDFGWKEGYYGRYYDENKKLAPNIAIYNKTPVKVEENRYIDVHMINSIGYGFDVDKQPDHKYFDKIGRDDAEAELKKRYLGIFLKILACAKDYGLNRIVMSLVGANNFAFEYPYGGKDELQKKIWYPAFKDFYNKYIKGSGVDLDFMGASGSKILNKINDNLDSGIENLGRFPGNALRLGTEERNKTLFVNAWDPWSLPGNGNFSDPSLDGYVGRVSAVALLSFPPVNKYLTDDKYMPVKVPTPFRISITGKNLDGGFKIACRGGQKIKVVNESLTNNAREGTVFLDAGGSAFRGEWNDAKWSGGGVSGAIYGFLNIDGKYIKEYLSEEEFKKVKERNSAVYKEYKKEDKTIGVIHVVSKNFGDRRYTREKIKRELKRSYQQVERAWDGIYGSNKELRLVVLSGSIYAGSHKDDILRLTPEIICDIFSEGNDDISIYELDPDSYNKLIKPYK